MGESGHVMWMIGLYVGTGVLYVAELALAMVSGSTQTEIFIHTMQNLSDEYNIEITPAPWTFSIWGFIYTWQAIWMVYGFTLICRRGKEGYLYVNPGVIHPGVLIGFSVSSAFIIVWLFVWDRLMSDIALAALFLSTLSSHIALFYGHRQLERITPTLVEQGQCKEVWFARIFVLNGIAFYNTWISIATCLNLAIAMTYTGPDPLPQKAACTIALGVLMAIVFTWFILKNLLFEKHLRFTYSPFVVLAVGLIGSIVKNWDRNNGNSLLTAMLLTLVGIFFVISVAHTVVRHTRENRRRFPLVNDQESVSSKTN